MDMREIVNKIALSGLNAGEAPFVLYMYDGDNVSVGYSFIPLDNDDIFEIMKERNAVEIAILTECWTVVREKDDKSDVRPSEDPNRREQLMVMWTNGTECSIDLYLLKGELPNREVEKHERDENPTGMGRLAINDLRDRLAGKKPTIN